jgi:hypothetical protein
MALHAHTVLLSLAGYPVPESALIHDRGQDTVRAWPYRQQREGAEGLQYELRVSIRPKTRWPTISSMP